MTEPTTEAGRTFRDALLELDRANNETTPVDWSHGIVAIEAEARALALAARRAAVQALLDTLAAVPHDAHATACTACLRDGFARTLDLLGPE